MKVKVEKLMSLSSNVYIYVGIYLCVGFMYRSAFIILSVCVHILVVRYTKGNIEIVKSESRQLWEYKF